jgi:hypothetical protein
MGLIDDPKNGSFPFALMVLIVTVLFLGGALLLDLTK